MIFEKILVHRYLYLQSSILLPYYLLCNQPLDFSLQNLHAPILANYLLFSFSKIFFYRDVYAGCGRADTPYITKPPNALLGRPSAGTPAKATGRSVSGLEKVCPRRCEQDHSAFHGNTLPFRLILTLIIAVFFTKSSVFAEILKNHFPNGKAEKLYSPDKKTIE